MGKLTLNRPSLQSLICNLPYFGRHVTSPNQGLPSLASWGVKRRDPGNEVAKKVSFSNLDSGKGKSAVTPNAKYTENTDGQGKPSAEQQYYLSQMLFEFSRIYNYLDLFNQDKTVCLQ